MGVKRKRYTKKSIHKVFSVLVLLLLLIVSLGYLIFKTDFLDIAEVGVTSQYISYNNLDSTDSIIVNKIEKKTRKKGLSKFNPSSVAFTVNGDKGKYFEIVLYPVDGSIDDGVMFHLENGSKEYNNNISSVEKKEDGGRIIYQGYLSNNNSFILRMWIGNNSTNKFNSLSYNVKIKMK